MISSSGSRKYAVKVILPSGKAYIFTRVKNNLALIPVSGNTVEGRFLAFDTPAQARQFLKEIKEKYPTEFAKIWKMKPHIIPVNVLQ